ncbi:MAG TPA: UDP-N-acetylmuramoyl-L-alanyl-D-glutamate--2,6-diaminopimelate ligase [Natronosporangium sp.]
MTAPPVSCSVTSLVFGLRKATAYGPLAGQVSGITQDSRQVRPGMAFVAIAGEHADGHDHLASAVARGASLLVVQADRRSRWESLLYEELTVLSVPDTREALGRLAATFYDNPSKGLTVIGVTGTNGKTTTAFFIAGVILAARPPVALLSTAGTIVAGRFTPNQSHLTTPDAVSVHRFLAEARAAGVRYAIVESTSHGLEQGRLAEVDFQVAVLTNLTGDHLDYHGDRAAYLRAKARLFEQLKPAGTAVLNGDEPAAVQVAARTAGRRLYYGIDHPGEVFADQLVSRGWQTSYRLHAAGRATRVRLRLPGRFNVANSLAAATTGVALGIDLAEIRRGLESVTKVPGRMERIAVPGGPAVVIDYAHNGHGLAEALTFLRTATTGRLIAVFGAAGDRDPARRPELARAAARLADYAIVTSDDSWQEDPAAIADEIARGFAGCGKRAGRDYAVELDRRKAIELALEAAGPADTVLLAGMGHERSMMTAGGPVPWDDRQVVHELLATREPGVAEPRCAADPSCAAATEPVPAANP